MKKFIILVLLFFSVINFIFANSLDISEYKYFRNLLPQNNKEGSFFINLNEDIYNKANHFLNDLRIVDEKNTEIQYSLQKHEDKQVEEKKEYKINILSKIEDKSQNEITYIIDFGENVTYHNVIRVDSKSVDFSRKVKIFGTDDLESDFLNINLDSEKDDKIISGPALSDFFINYKFNNYRFLKLIIYGKEGNFNVDSFSFLETKTQLIDGNKKEYDLQIIKNTKKEEETEILVSMFFDNLPIDYFIITAKQLSFSVPILIYSSNNKDAIFSKDKKNNEEFKDYWKLVYDGKFSKKIYDETNKIFFNDNKKYYLIIIKHEKDKELVDPFSVKGGRYLERLYLNNLDFNNHSYKLIYGNQSNFKPAYVNKNQSILSEQVQNELNLSEEQENSFFEVKNKIKKNNKETIFYLIIFLFILFLFWIIYKIVKEHKNKDIDDNPYINKL